MTRKAALLFFAVALVVILLPATVVSLGPLPGNLPQDPGSNCPEGGDECKNNGGREIHLYRTDRKEVLAMDLEEYLTGVLLAEMPSSFALEALKTQAVIARTYALRQMRSSGGEGCGRSSKPADICSDSTHCQAWLDPVEKAVEWGPECEVFLERIRQAIAETSGEVAVFQGKLIEAVYHSTCGGKTEASHALWEGGQLAYLCSVNCPYCEHSPYYRGEMLVTFAQLAAALPRDLALPVASGEGRSLETSLTPGGRVAALKINGTPFEGKELRRLLELPSTAFTCEINTEGLLFYTRGHGHGVGLCQYGADGAAREGKNYRQIIALYYPGVELTKIVP